jgi:hypothetical protein
VSKVRWNGFGSAAVRFLTWPFADLGVAFSDLTVEDVKIIYGTEMIQGKSQYPRAKVPKSLLDHVVTRFLEVYTSEGTRNVMLMNSATRADYTLLVCLDALRPLPPFDIHAVAACRLSVAYAFISLDW